MDCMNPHSCALKTAGAPGGEGGEGASDSLVSSLAVLGPSPFISAHPINSPSYHPPSRIFQCLQSGTVLRELSPSSLKLTTAPPRPLHVLTPLTSPASNLDSSRRSPKPGNNLPFESVITENGEVQTPPETSSWAGGCTNDSPNSPKSGKEGRKGPMSMGESS